MSAQKSPQLDHFRRNCIPVRIGDDTMEPWLNSNDWVFIDPTDKRLIDSLAAFELPDEFEPRIYRVQHIGSGRVLMKLDNDKYQNQEMSVERARLLMVGRVCGILKSH